MALLLRKLLAKMGSFGSGAQNPGASDQHDSGLTGYWLLPTASRLLRRQRRCTVDVLQYLLRASAQQRLAYLFAQAHRIGTDLPFAQNHRSVRMGNDGGQEIGRAHV